MDDEAGPSMASDGLDTRIGGMWTLAQRRAGQQTTAGCGGDGQAWQDGEAEAIIDEFTEKAQDTPLERERQAPGYPTPSPAADVDSVAVVDTREWRHVVRERRPRRGDIFTQSPSPVLLAWSSARQPMK